MDLGGSGEGIGDEEGGGGEGSSELHGLWGGWSGGEAGGAGGSQYLGIDLLTSRLSDGTGELKRVSPRTRCILTAF